MPQDAGPDNTYEVTIRVTEQTPQALYDEVSVQVQVTNVNERPTVAAMLSDQERYLSDGVLRIDLSGAFSDPDGDDLIYGAWSGTPLVATTSVSGEIIEFTSRAEGAATITVTAYDRPAGTTRRLSVQQIFTVTVRAPASISITRVGSRLEQGSSRTFLVNGHNLDPTQGYQV